MSTVMSLCASSARAGFGRCGPFGWALATGGLAVTAYSFLVNDTVLQFVTATFEEFWIIVILTLLSLCFTEYSKKKHPFRKKILPEHDDDDEASSAPSSRKEKGMPGSQAGAGQKEERRHKNEVSISTAQFMTAMESGKLLLAEASIERLERLQTSAQRASLQKFLGKGYAELVQAFVQAGQAEKAKRWFTALAGSMPKSRPSSPGAAKQGEEQARWQDFDVNTEQLSELVRKCAREGQVNKAEGLLTLFVDFAPIMQPAAFCCMNSVVSACAKGGHVASSEAWLTKMLAMGLCPDEASFKALVNAYARQGNVAQAQGWLNKMIESLPQAQSQSYHFDLVSQACGQMNAPSGTQCGLRPEAPEFQPPVQAGEGSFKFRAEAPEFELGPAAWQKTALRSEAPSFQSMEEMAEPAGGAARGHWGQRRLAGNVYSDESWGLLRKTMSDLAEEGRPKNSSLVGVWRAGTGEVYEVEVDGTSLRATRYGTWGSKHFAIEYDSYDRRYWWGDAKKLCFDPEDFLSNRTEISWYRANDTQRRYPAFTWYKQADATVRKPVKPVVKEPATSVAKEDVTAVAKEADTQGPTKRGPKGTAPDQSDKRRMPRPEVPSTSWGRGCGFKWVPKQ